jgi:hypothetical protein
LDTFPKWPKQFGNFTDYQQGGRQKCFHKSSPDKLHQGINGHDPMLRVTTLSQHARSTPYALAWFSSDTGPTSKRNQKPGITRPIQFSACLREKHHPLIFLCPSNNLHNIPPLNLEFDSRHTKSKPIRNCMTIWHFRDSVFQAST